MSNGFYKELGSIHVNLRQLAKKLPISTDALLSMIELVRITQISLVGASNTSEDD